MSFLLERLSIGSLCGSCGRIIPASIPRFSSQGIGENPRFSCLGCVSPMMCAAAVQAHGAIDQIPGLVGHQYAQPGLLEIAPAVIELLEAVHQGEEPDPSLGGDLLLTESPAPAGPNEARSRSLSPAQRSARVLSPGSGGRPPLYPRLRAVFVLNDEEGVGCCLLLLLLLLLMLLLQVLAYSAHRSTRTAWRCAHVRWPSRLCCRARSPTSGGAQPRIRSRAAPSPSF